MKRVLIANRGEIAQRILRACRASGLEVVVAHSQADSNLGYLHLADDAVCISKTSYLDPEPMLAAALSRQCDAIHPGYGFLSENAAFAAQIESHDLTFIGPEANHIALMGNKSKARAVMAEHNVPVLSGSEDEVQSQEEALMVAAEVGYPVLLKASFGGGGRGILVATDADSLQSGFARISQESQSLFGSGSVYVEKYLMHARHIEVQVAGDGRGTVIHLGARECSLQRRHQKVLEECPPPGLPADAIEKLAQQCCAALSALAYRNLGTLEFLYEDGEFYFIEMNTRLQVEHPVTEEVTGIDLVQMQLHIAAEGQLPLSQGDVRLRGHALECRINAEDDTFSPAPGRVGTYVPPGGPGVRLDSHLYAGYDVPHQYDSLLAKLVCFGSDRGQAIARMKNALHEFEIQPIKTNLPLHRAIVDHPSFLSGELDTGFLERMA